MKTLEELMHERIEAAEADVRQPCPCANDEAFVRGFDEAAVDLRNEFEYRKDISLEDLLDNAIEGCVSLHEHLNPNDAGLMAYWLGSKSALESLKTKFNNQ